MLKCDFFFLNKHVSYSLFCLSVLLISMYFFCHYYLHLTSGKNKLHLLKHETALYSPTNLTSERY